MKVCAEAGATAVLRTCRVGSAALVAPASAYHLSRKYLKQIRHAFAPDTNRIGSASIADLHHIRNRYTTDRNLIDRRIV